MIETGNAADLGAARGGWMLGHFMPTDSPLRSDDVEVKWANHRAGDRRGQWAPLSSASTLSILVRGRFVVEFREREVVLEREGDFVFWDGAEPHSWRCEADCTIVTVRWPSA